jgi:hypothetical protein
MPTVLHFFVINARRDVASVYEQRVKHEIYRSAAVALFHQLL